MKRRNRYINTKDFGERGLLRDGRVYRAKLTMMDSRDSRIANVGDLYAGRTNAAKLTDAQGNSGLALNRPGYRLLEGDMNVSERQKAYDAYDHDLRTAYRRDAGKGDVVPDAPKVSGNDATPVEDIETAYRLYAEEISEAWKTPR
ncbi:MAG: hypothetical protein WB689_21530 [Xanthobacteraceae bacterium]